MSFPARLDVLGGRLRGQPELQQDDSVAYVQGGRAERRGWICVPGKLNESQYQQPGNETRVLSISRPVAPGLLMLRPTHHPLLGS